MEKILKFELDGDYKFFLSIIQDLATVSNVKELSQQVANNVFIFLEASGASIFVLRKSNGVEIVSKKIEKKSLKVISERNDLSTLMNQINISLNSEGKPWSEKVCDYVASTGDVVNLQIPSEVRFVTRRKFKLLFHLSFTIFYAGLVKNRHFPFFLRLPRSVLKVCTTLP